MVTRPTHGTKRLRRIVSSALFAGTMESVVTDEEAEEVRQWLGLSDEEVEPKSAQGHTLPTPPGAHHHEFGRGPIAPMWHVHLEGDQPHEHPYDSEAVAGRAPWGPALIRPGQYDTRIPVGPAVIDDPEPKVVEVHGPPQVGLGAHGIFQAVPGPLLGRFTIHPDGRVEGWAP